MLNFRRRSYVENILAHKISWRPDGIVNENPFRELTKPLLDFGKWFYFVLGLLQLAFMSAFATIYTPDWTGCPSGHCNQNATSSWSAKESGYPNGLWLVWPSIVLLYNGYMYSASVSSEVCYVVSLLRQKRSEKVSRSTQSEEVPTRLLLATADRLPPCGFALALFVWFNAHCFWPDHPHYYQVTI